MLGFLLLSCREGPIRVSNSMCPERIGLLEEYSNCTGAYRQAVEDLKNSVYDDPEKYTELAAKAEQTRLA